MTVAELIDYLKTLQPDRYILTRGYEGGYCDITTADLRDVELNVNSAWYYGPHDDADADSSTKHTAYVL